MNLQRFFGCFFIFIAFNAMAGEDCCISGKGGGEASQELEEIVALAEKGDPEAQNTLAWRYQEGIGVRKDYECAAKWYRLAAEQGVFQAQESLGGLYYQGLPYAST